MNEVSIARQDDGTVANASDNESDKEEYDSDNEVPAEDMEKKLFEKDSLLQTIPEIYNQFTDIQKIGSGTFSSVYRAVPLDKKKFKCKYVALKCIFQLSSAPRIINEAKHLHELRELSSIVTLYDVERYNRINVFVLQYVEHTNEHDYLHNMEVDLARHYMKCLFQSLADLEKKRIVHRDVKPQNFLYNHFTKEYMLIDFGLSHKSGYDKTKDKNKERKPGKTTSNARARQRISSGNPLRTIGKARNPKPPPVNLTAVRGIINEQEQEQKQKQTPPATGPPQGQQKPATNNDKQQSNNIKTNGNGIINNTLPQSKYDNAKKEQRLKKENQVPGQKSIEEELLSEKKQHGRQARLSLPSQSSNNKVKSQQQSQQQQQQQQKSALAKRSRLSSYKVNSSKCPPRMSGKTGTQRISLFQKQAAVKRKTSNSNQSYSNHGSHHNNENVNSLNNMSGSNVNTKRTNKEIEKQATAYGKPGIVKDDDRKSLHHTAGTRGFRAPEQLAATLLITTAADVWAAGMILLSIASGRYPLLFTSRDDEVFEIIRLVGTEGFEEKDNGLECSFHFECPFEIPAATPKGLREKCEIMRKTDKSMFIAYPDELYDLLYNCLLVNPNKRIKASEALRHPFLKDIK